MLFRSTPINASDPVREVMIAHMWATITVQLDGKGRDVALTKKAVEKAGATRKRAGKGAAPLLDGEKILLHKAVLALIPDAERGSGPTRESRRNAVKNVVQAAWVKASQKIRDVAKQPNVRARAEREWRKALKEKVEARLKPVFKEIGSRLTKKLLLEIWEETHKEQVVSEVMER